MKLIILDRDGVINEDSPDFVKSPEEWHAIPGSLEAIALMNRANISVAIASNQSGIARGLFSEITLDAIHQKMAHELMAHQGYIDRIFYCPHGPNDHCECRKPKPGLLFQAMQYFNIAPEDTYFVGDSQRDIDAAIAAHCQPVLVRSGNGSNTTITDASNLPVYNDLLAFAQTLTGKNS
ncbi:MAG: D-glycero-beta-D-manno-heptose 1,7-bisphosphate 7-phosphatase [Gammaproteobacteria bacterium]|nr:D-glycero-beta-D-manno-heptose 1,7-bisphosphate 7-phosphatase [Gammaproteobacteria bacterium]